MTTPTKQKILERIDALKIEHANALNVVKNEIVNLQTSDKIIEKEVIVNAPISDEEIDKIRDQAKKDVHEELRKKWNNMFPAIWNLYTSNKMLMFSLVPDYVLEMFKDWIEENKSKSDFKVYNKSLANRSIDGNKVG